MKVLRSVEWTPIAWMDSCPGIDEPVYVFKNKRYGDVATLKVAKYVDVSADNVFIYIARERFISSRRDGSKIKETSLPRYTCI